MSKVARYLQEHLLGEVTVSPEVRQHFAHDASILRMVPSIVVYPRNENDVRKTARFSWQLAARQRIVPITARGAGSDTSGAALGSGIVLVLTAHMNKVLAMDAKKEFITVEPGASFDKIEQTLFTHGMFLPPYPQSKNYATIGGGLANNASGEKSVKYGVMGDYVDQLRVVLANGEVIETGPLNKRELNKKLGISSFEGEIYRSIDGLIEENQELIKTIKERIRTPRNVSGYNIADVRGKDGSFDLTPLFVGSQGTLGIITEATLEVVPHNPQTRLCMVSLDSLHDLNEVLPKVLELKPSICEMVNHAAVHQVVRANPTQLSGLFEKPEAAVHLFIEFDDPKDASQKTRVKKLTKLVEKSGGYCQAARDPEEQEKFWKIRHSVSTLLTRSQGQGKSVPVAEDIAVPVNRVVEFLHLTADIYEKAGWPAAAWGPVGDGVIRMQPILDLSQLGDRQKLFKLTEAMYEAAIDMGGSTTGASGDGRVRAPYLSRLYGEELYNLMLRVKRVFDPYGTLNPGVKTGATLEDVKSLMRGEYNLTHRHEHLPHS